MQHEDFAVWPSCVSNYKLNKFMTQPYLNDLVYIKAERGKDTLLYRLCYDEYCPLQEFDFMTKNGVKKAKSPPTFRTAPRGIRYQNVDETLTNFESEDELPLSNFINATSSANSKVRKLVWTENQTPTDNDKNDDGDEYDVRVAVGGVEILPPPIDEDIPAVDVDVEGAAVDDLDADLDFIDEGISDEFLNTPREMVYRKSFLNLSRTTDPQSQLYCYTSSFVEVHTPSHVERLCLMCHFDYSAIVNNDKYYAHVADYYINSD
ncbi:hypothetical protein JTB14_014124 [Gonioctena quinquepunctata]|nr:hypothetical protein JTB14_014124 [Gonioctena quinquepunctata]